MALDKSTVKIRLENEMGDRVPFGDVGSRLSCKTTGKLKSLDTNGDGELSLQELVDSVDAQARQKHQLFLQRCVIIAGLSLLVCSFGLSLGSSILSFMLMTKLEVHSGALTDREGHILGSEPRNPTVSNVTLGAAAVRRLESTGSSDAQLTIPIEDFNDALAKYKAGSSEFIVPIEDSVYTVRILASGPLYAHGHMESGEEWEAQCQEGGSHCSVAIRQLQARAALPEGQEGRRLFDFCGTLQCDPCAQNDGWEVGPCTSTTAEQTSKNWGCHTNWCFNQCCYPNDKENNVPKGHAAGVRLGFLAVGDGITTCFAASNSDGCTV